MTARWIAEQEVALLGLDKKRLLCKILIGTPISISEGEARCPVSIVGLDSQVFEISGSSTLQALLLAIRFLEMRLRDLASRGWSVQGRSGGAPLLAEVFGALPIGDVVPKPVRHGVARSARSRRTAKRTAGKK